MRKIFYKINLRYNTGEILPITVALTDINNIESLINRNKMLYNKLDKTVEGFTMGDVLYSLNMTEDQYEQELMFCDIVEE